MHPRLPLTKQELPKSLELIRYSTSTGKPRTPLRRANHGGSRPRQGKNGEAGDARQKRRAYCTCAGHKMRIPRSCPSPSAAITAAVAYPCQVWGGNETNMARRKENG